MIGYQWKFRYKLEEVLEASKKQKAFHEERAAFWKLQPEDDTIKPGGSFSPQNKRMEHEGKVREFSRWIRILEHEIENKNDPNLVAMRYLECTPEDLEYFGL